MGCKRASCGGKGTGELLAASCVPTDGWIAGVSHCPTRPRRPALPPQANEDSLVPTHAVLLANGLLLSFGKSQRDWPCSHPAPLARPGVRPRLGGDAGRRGRKARQVPTKGCAEGSSETVLSRKFNTRGTRDMESAFEGTQPGRRWLLMEGIPRLSPGEFGGSPELCPKGGGEAWAFLEVVQVWSGAEG